MKTAVLFTALAFSNLATAQTLRPNPPIPLPGLGVAIGMSVDQCANELQNFDFQHLPEKRWQKNGHSFVSQEQFVCTTVSLRELNEQLEEVRFVFEEHRLVEVNLTVLNLANAIKPLVEKLQLVQANPGVYTGLEGRIVMREDHGNAETTTWVIAAAEQVATSKPVKKTAVSKAIQGKDSPGDWVESNNGDLAIRLKVRSQRVSLDEDIVVIAQIRNNRSDQVTILRPFGDPYLAIAVELKIWGHQGRIKYTGPEADYDLNAEAFARLSPGEIVTGTMNLSPTNFAGTDKVGTLKVRYDYSYQGDWDKKVSRKGLKEIWRGAICSREVAVRKESVAK